MQEHGARPALNVSHPRTRAHATVIAGVAIAVVVVDQLTKWWATRVLAHRTIDLFWTFRLQLQRNSGAAFSVAGGRGAVIALLAIAVVVALIAFGRFVDTRVGAVALGLVLGGAFGNLADRIFRSGGGFLGGGVIDFIDPQWWPVFNVADAAVSVGGVLLVLVALRET